MIKERLTLTFALVVVALVTAPPADAEEHQDWSHQVELPEGEEAAPLFSGHDLDGWVGREDYFSVVDHQIRAANSDPVVASTYLFSKQEFRNFRLLLEVKQTTGEDYAKMHSAVAALGERISDSGGEYAFKGPLFMFCQDWGIWDAYGRNRVYPADQKTPMNDAPWEKVGEWNQIEILVVGDHVRMAANGQMVVDYVESPDNLKKSPLGLQLHNHRLPQEFHFRGLLIVKDPTDVMASVQNAE